MITAAAYVLNVREDRREVLLGGPISLYSLDELTVAEPVNRF